jgi:predicted metal-binding protein
MTQSRSQITVYGDKEVVPPRVISMIKAEKFMRQGCEAYLAYVIEAKAQVK